MADFPVEANGQIDDRVRIELANRTIEIVESYEVRSDVLTVPAAWSVRMGYGEAVRTLIPLVQPGAPFKLYIGPVLQQTGQIDGYSASADVGATELNVTGRDALAPLHDAYVTSEISIKDATYRDIVAWALYRTLGPDRPFVLGYTNETNRKIVTGVGVKQVAPLPDASQVEIEATTPKAIRVAVQAKLGEREYEFVKRQLDRAGLFLWAGANGDFIVSAPNAKQLPTYEIKRQRGATRSFVNATSARYTNNTVPRFSEVIVHARGGGRKFSRSKTKGSYADPEMAGYGFHRPLVVRDVNVATAEQAEFYARRKLAESIRAGWQLTYTIAGHTLPSLVGGGRAVVAPDTVVRVADDEFGLYGNYYVESCVYRGGPDGRVTEINLLRPDSLVFAEGEF